MKNSKFVFDKVTKIFEQGLITSKDLGSEIISILKFDKSNLIIGLIEIYGILSAILFLKSFYRPKM